MSRAERLVERWRRPAFLGLSLVGAVIVVALVLNPDAHGLDARGYWAFDPSDPYREAVGNLNAVTAFRYAPPVALAFMLLQALSWPAFITLWTVVCVLALVYLSGRWALALAALYPVAMELSAGNVNLLIGAAVLAGFRWPAAWSFVLLTKITPGVGLFWFVVRREWAALARVAAATAALSVASWVIAPALWPQWIAALRSMIGLEPEGLHLPVPLPVRIVAAGALIAWGARTDRRWTVLVGATFALPSIWLASLSPLAGLVGLRRDHRDFALRWTQPLRSGTGTLGSRFRRK